MLCTNINSSNKVILPFFVSKEIRPVSFLLSPKSLVVCTTIIIILAQISDSLKIFLPLKDIQKFPSVKIYSKLLSAGLSSVLLSSVFAISKTLGPDLEILSSLSSSERLIYIRSLYFNLINQKVAGNLSTFPRLFFDPFELLKYRKNLALKCRSTFLATSLFLPHSLVLGVPLANVNLEIILQSCKNLWVSYGLDEFEFDFLLRKESLNLFLSDSHVSFFSEPTNIYDSVKFLVFSEFEKSLFLDGKIVFSHDNFLFRNSTNLTVLEQDLGFFSRSCPKIIEHSFLSDSELKDDIIRLSVEQRKSCYSNNFYNLYFDK